ncbi:hypothetical protein [Leptospira perolatii]|nr:hypothetical protein [Leptospira perolatii]
MEAVDFDEVYEYYKKGNYSRLVKISRPELRKGEVDYKILLLYVASEHSLEEIDKTLTSIDSNQKNHPSIFYNAVYLFLERALVLEASEPGLRWGKIFVENGKSSVKYAEGLYTYACILYSSRKYEEVGTLLEKMNSISKSEKLEKRIKILSLQLDKIKGEK